jgi:inner membrane protein
MLAAAVGTGALRPMLMFSGLSLLPDLDYVAVMMGLPDTGPCGHRGATHSLALPLLVAMVAAALAPRLRLPRWRFSMICGLVVSSHLVLDAMTFGSRGVPALWPLSFARFQLPWRPIPNAPCGLEYLSAAGLRVASIELLLFLPLLVVALWPLSSKEKRRDPDRGGRVSVSAQGGDRLVA